MYGNFWNSKRRSASQNHRGHGIQYQNLKWSWPSITALAANTPLIIVDEITAVLDPETRFLFFSTLKETVKTKNTSIILATNIAEDLINIANRVLFLTQEGAKEYDQSKILELFNVGKSA